MDVLEWIRITKVSGPSDTSCWYGTVLGTEISLPVLSYESKGMISQSRIRDCLQNRRFIFPTKETCLFPLKQIFLQLSNFEKTKK